MLGVSGALVLLTGCATYMPSEVADPDTITLRDAMIDVADSIAEVQAHSIGRQKVGMFVDEVEITFNVSTKAVGNNELKLAASNMPLPIGGVLGVNPAATLQNDSQRGNQIKVKFKNVINSQISPAGTALLDKCNRDPSACNPVLFGVKPKRDILG